MRGGHREPAGAFGKAEAGGWRGARALSIEILRVGANTCSCSEEEIVQGLRLSAASPETPPTALSSLNEGLRMHQRTRDRALSREGGCQGRLGMVRSQTISSKWSKKSASHTVGKHSAHAHQESWASRITIAPRSLAGEAACRWERPPPARSALTHAPVMRRARH